MNTREIVEPALDESEELIEALFAHLYDNEHVIDHDWRQGDLVAWDNLAVQHARKTVQIEGPVREPCPRWSARSPRWRASQRLRSSLQGRLTLTPPIRADPTRRVASPN